MASSTSLMISCVCILLVCLVVLNDAWFLRRRRISNGRPTSSSSSSSYRYSYRSYRYRAPQSRSSYGRTRVPSRPKCASKGDCWSCVRLRSWSGKSCRWCPRDNRCHAYGALFTNPCSRAENVVYANSCPGKIINPTTKKRKNCASKGDCLSCINSRSWSGKSCRWCPKDKRCHAYGAVFTNPCSKAENIHNGLSCGKTTTRLTKTAAVVPRKRETCAFKQDCVSCANHKGLLGLPCRWCVVNKQCHTPGAIFVNPCTTSQNIVEASKCSENVTIDTYRCSSKLNCSSCTNHKSWFFKLPCRWCEVDHKCHAPGAILVNPCNISQNIIKPDECPKPPPDPPTCVSKTDCMSCISQNSWSRSPCRWCPQDRKCHAHDAIFTNPCRQGENCSNSCSPRCTATPTSTASDTSTSSRYSTASTTPTPTTVIERSTSSRYSTASTTPIPTIVIKTPQATANISLQNTSNTTAIYNKSLAYQMVQLVALAYAENISSCIIAARKPEVDSFCLVKRIKIDLYYSGVLLVSHQEKAITIAFMDCMDMKLLRFFTNPTESFPAGGKVHQFFNEVFFKIWNDLKDDVKKTIKRYPNYQVWVTGHSLGGALASLASTLLSHEDITSKYNLFLYTFGQPRVGNYEYASKHDSLVPFSFRVTHYGDPVVRLPSCNQKNGEITCVNQTGCSYHHGNEVYCGNVTMVKDAPYKECDGRPRNEDVTCSNKPLVNPVSNDHLDYFGLTLNSWCSG